MKTIEFSLRRISLLIGRDVRKVYRLSGIVLAAGFVVLAILLFQSFSDLGGVQREFYEGSNDLLMFHFEFFPIALLISGILFTDYVFAGLISRPGRAAYVSLPATNLEKLTAKWLLTALIFPVVFLLFYQVFALFAGRVIYQSFGWRLVELPLFDAWLWSRVLLYMMVHAFFFLGALTFRRFAAFKTVLALAGLYAVSSFLFSFFVYVFIPEASFHWQFWGFDLGDNLAYSGDFQLLKDRINVLLNGVYVLLAGLMLFIGFFKLKEMEVS